MTAVSRFWPSFWRSGWLCWALNKDGDLIVYAGPHKDGDLTVYAVPHRGGNLIVYAVPHSGGDLTVPALTVEETCCLSFV